MSVHYLLDGYNIIKQTPGLNQGSLEAQRNALLAWIEIGQPQGSLQNTVTVVFDGKDSRGNQLPDGFYNYTVLANDSDDNPIVAKTYSTGRISSVRLENGSPVFQMGNRDLGVSDIQRIF